MDILGVFFKITPENIFCYPSLEPSCQDNSMEAHNKRFDLEKSIMP